MSKRISNCDFCGNKKEVIRTNYGTSSGYVRLICRDCKRFIESSGDKVKDLDK